ncbi:MAG: hypothetical protein KAS66_09765 [Candidatus Omnitrophica bacterium]|nr:hypothetical protein [Candidatus Omnitrophota bacterium]
MKKIVLLSGIIIGCFMLTVMFPIQSTLAADKAELMPMELDGTEWAIEMTSITKKGEKEVDEDMLIFKNKQFISKAYDKKGYEPTNYSLTVRTEDVTSFGTMQIKDKETSFWKGAVTGEKIDGSLHIQYPEGKNETRYYKGELSSGTLKRREDPTVRKSVEPPAPPLAVKKEPVPLVVEDAKKPTPVAEESQPDEVK